MVDISERIALYGVDALSDRELLAALVGEETADIAMDAAEGELARLARMTLRELAQLPTIGPVRAGRLLSALTLARRVRSGARELRQLNCSEAVAAYFGPRLVGLAHEELWVVLLNAKNRVMGERCLARGGLIGLSVHPREIFGVAVREQAAGVILVHNHPSGDPTPSEYDRELTRRARSAGDILGIALLDHVVVGDGAAFSALGGAGW